MFVQVSFEVPCTPTSGVIRVPSTPRSAPTFCVQLSNNESLMRAQDDLLRQELTIRRREQAIRTAKLEQQEAQLRNASRDSATAELTKWYNGGAWSLSSRRLSDLRTLAGDKIPGEICRAITKQCGGV